MPSKAIANYAFVFALHPQITALFIYFPRHSSHFSSSYFETPVARSAVCTHACTHIAYHAEYRLYGRKRQRQPPTMAKGKKKNAKKSTPNSQSNHGWMSVDPSRVRFQHSKIRPVFSGCGRSVFDTLESIRNGEIQPEDMPPIQVIPGPDGWYFALNNRRLWVLKRCREEGLLKDGLIRVRVREAKSAVELERYSIKNCALEAKFMREQAPVDINEGTKSLSLQDPDKNDIVKEKSCPQSDDPDINADERSIQKGDTSLNENASESESEQDISIDDDGNVESDEESSTSADEAPQQQYKNPFCLGDSSDSSDSDSE